MGRVEHGGGQPQEGDQGDGSDVAGPVDDTLQGRYDVV